MDFVIDTAGTRNTSHQDVGTEIPSSESALKNALNNYKSSLISAKDILSIGISSTHVLGNPSNTFTETAEISKKKKITDTRKQKEINEILKKSVVLNPEFETLHSVPEYDVSRKRLREQRRLEREKTKGSKWFNLPATTMTEEIKHDLQVLKMRSALDPKHFYKKNDLNVLPKYFQVGKVLDSPLDYYNRIPQKERKKTLVDELLADAEFSKYNKRKYKEIIEQRQKTHYKAWRQAKRLKRKNKKK